MIFKKKQSAYDKQIGGNHYNKFPIQPADFINKNKLLFIVGRLFLFKNHKANLKCIVV